MIQVERYDKQPEAREKEIQKDWKAWAEANGYTELSSIAIQQVGIPLSLEVWENPLTEKDKFLLLFPQIPGTKGTEKLIILNTKVDLDFMIDAAQKMLAVAVVMVNANRGKNHSNLN